MLLSTHVSAIDFLGTDVQVLFAPLYKGLSIESFLEEGLKDSRVKDYLPDEKDRHRLPRQYVINVIHTIVG